VDNQFHFNLIGPYKMRIIRSASTELPKIKRTESGGVQIYLSPKMNYPYLSTELSREINAKEMDEFTKLWILMNLWLFNNNLDQPEYT